jgi:hypothetical protein
MATCAVNGTITDPAGEAMSSVSVYARVLQPVFVGTQLVAPQEISTFTDASGNFVLTVQQSVSVVFTVQYPVVGTEPMRTFNYTGTIPGTATATFSSIVVVE